MHLIDRIINKANRKSYISQKIKETTQAANTGASQILLFDEKDHYMLELSILLKSAWFDKDARLEFAKNKLIAYIRIDDNRAKLIGVIMDSPLFTEKGKGLLIDWEKHVSTFVDELNTRLYGEALADDDVKPNLN